MSPENGTSLLEYPSLLAETQRLSRGTDSNSNFEIRISTWLERLGGEAIFSDQG
jgi:hypothetical protein